jgi:hypothetical protein
MNDETWGLVGFFVCLSATCSLETHTKTLRTPFNSLSMAQKLETHQLKAEKLFSVAGRVCLMTGGGTGIGLMCAQVLGKGHPVPAGRAGSDEEMAMACLFPVRKRYVNGEIVVVDGGLLGKVLG